MLKMSDVFMLFFSNRKISHHHASLTMSHVFEVGSDFINFSCFFKMSMGIIFFILFFLLCDSIIYLFSLYEGHSINKANFAEGLAIRTVYSCTFFKEINNNGSLLCSRKLSAWLSLVTALPRTFSLPESQCVSTP